eukprot:Nk52_evm3s639 gene=Nk52_evmTU3s639
MSGDNGNVRCLDILSKCLETCGTERAEDVASLVLFSMLAEKGINLKENQAWAREKGGEEGKTEIVDVPYKKDESGIQLFYKVRVPGYNLPGPDGLWTYEFETSTGPYAKDECPISFVQVLPIGERGRISVMCGFADDKREMLTTNVEVVGDYESLKASVLSADHGASSMIKKQFSVIQKHIIDKIAWKVCDDNKEKGQSSSSKESTETSSSRVREEFVDPLRVGPPLGHDPLRAYPPRGNDPLSVGGVGYHPPRNPFSLGSGDLNPGGFGDDPSSGGMIMGPGHPIFQGRSGRNNNFFDDGMGYGLPPPPPGARFDPIRPPPPGPLPDGVPGRSEPDPDHLPTPHGYDDMFM